MRRRQRSEQIIQRTLFQHIHARGVHGLVALHPANGGYRKPVEAKIMQGLGVVAGAPDILLWHDGRSFALELKSEGGQVTDLQRKMLDDLSRAGVTTAIAYGLDKALAVLEGWRLLRGTVH
jgi:hypothetical protein